jgi:pseudouridylate synthase
MNLPPYYALHPEVAQALERRQPVVALETAVVTHGLPQPTNLELAADMERAVRSMRVVPATIGVLDGQIRIGLTPDEVKRLGTDDGLYKVSRRDFGVAITRNGSGGTTVAGTLIAAHAVGIRVFATGGIGGVHRGAPFDVSTDLHELARTPLVVVCAGAKAILDLPATLEVLETLGVPVIGYRTPDFPAFYSRSSGLPVQIQVESVGEVAAIARAHWGLGIRSAVLVTVPPPSEVALERELVEDAIEKALEKARRQGISGQAVTPFLLSYVAKATHGASMRANLALLLNNARIAAQIATELSSHPWVSA